MQTSLCFPHGKQHKEGQQAPGWDVITAHKPLCVINNQIAHIVLVLSARSTGRLSQNLYWVGQQEQWQWLMINIFCQQRCFCALINIAPLSQPSCWDLLFQDFDRCALGMIYKLSKPFTIIEQRGKYLQTTTFAEMKPDQRWHPKFWAVETLIHLRLQALIECYNINTADAISRLDIEPVQDEKAKWMMFMKRWCHYTMHSPTTVNQKLLESSLTLVNGQSVSEGYRRFEECKNGLWEILHIVSATNLIIMPKDVENLFSVSYGRLLQVMGALSQIRSHFIFAGLFNLV